MIPDHEWLDVAKRLPVGMSQRVFHRRENRPNLIIANKRDRWTCYCQRCKEGSTVMKDHVLLNGSVELTAADLKRPDDLARVLGSDYENLVGSFLARKGMMYPFLPELWFSVRAKRVLLQDPSGGWHGRDLTERSAAKWLHYDKQNIAGCVAKHTVVTEDLFSMFKCMYALGARPAKRVYRALMPDLNVACTLGANCGTGAVLALQNCSTIIWAYDADQAGDSGYLQGSKRMRVFVPRQLRARPPEGLDPKDMQCKPLRDLIMEGL